VRGQRDHGAVHVRERVEVLIRAQRISDDRADRLRSRRRCRRGISPPPPSSRGRNR
jgi:hypothetical protein